MTPDPDFKRLYSRMSQNLNSVKWVICWSTIGVLKGDTRGLGYSSYGTSA